MAKERKITYSENDRAIVNALRDSEGMTLVELREATGLDLKPAHITHALTSGLIEKIGEKETFKEGVRSVNTYAYVDSEIRMNGDKPFNYTDNEKGVLAAAAGIEGDFTLADLAAAMGIEKLSSGSINGLVKKGNIAKAGQREVPSLSKSKVGVYGFLADIPSAE